jgi:hypothetical protein
MENSFNFILILATLVINILSILGILFLTKFSFQSSNTDNKRCILLSDTELKLTLLAIVLFWICFLLNIFHNLYINFDKIKIDF